MKKMLLKLIFVCMLFSFSIVLASSSETKKIPFSYNVIPTIKRESAIDNNSQKELYFNLYEHTDKIYYNNSLVEIHDDTFHIDISQLSGKTKLVFKNENGDEAIFTYFFANENGLLKDYELVANTNLYVYITTYKGITIIYSDKEKNSLKDIKNYIESLPDSVIKNVNTIKMIPYANTFNIAGVTIENDITLYRGEKMSYNDLIACGSELKVKENSYTEFSKSALMDKNAVSTYSKHFAQENGKYSEDFADSVAFFFISSSFGKKYPNRAKYIQNLLNVQL